MKTRFRPYIFALLLFVPLLAHAQGSEVNGQEMLGPQPYPGAPRLTSEEIRVVADILSKANGTLSFANGGTGQALLRAQIAADPNAAGMSTGEISDITNALTRYAQLKSAAPEAAVTAPQQQYWTIPVAASVPSGGAGALTPVGASPVGTSSAGSPAVVVMELLGLLAALAAFGVAVRFHRRSKDV